jgi:hypothetical protein
MNSGTQYQVFDEAGDLMRIVGRKDEALAVVALRNGWTYKKINVEKPKFEFKDALI